MQLTLQHTHPSVITIVTGVSNMIADITVIVTHVANSAASITTIVGDVAATCRRRGCGSWSCVPGAVACVAGDMCAILLLPSQRNCNCWCLDYSHNCCWGTAICLCYCGVAEGCQDCKYCICRRRQDHGWHSSGDSVALTYAAVVLVAGVTLTAIAAVAVWSL